MSLIRYIVRAVIVRNAVLCAAQPGPPSFCFVVADDGPKQQRDLTVRTEGRCKVERMVAHYNLDMIISVGYRVNSLVAM